jgi:hypothetical protein
MAGTMDKADEAVSITTVDVDGWPRTALLSLAEVVLADDGRIAILLYNGSTSAANLRRDGRLLLTLPAAGSLFDLRFGVEERGPVLPGPSRATFVGALCAAREQRAPYATVTSGIGFTLHSPDTVLPRWRDQLAHLRGTLEIS